MARLDFLWQLQAREEKLDMEALQVEKNTVCKVFVCANSCSNQN